MEAHAALPPSMSLERYGSVAIDDLRLWTSVVPCGNCGGGFGLSGRRDGGAGSDVLRAVAAADEAGRGSNDLRNDGIVLAPKKGEVERGASGERLVARGRVDGAAA